MTVMFPDDFRFGTSTSSYQIEGAVGADGRGASIWDSFSHTAGAIADGTTGNVACDHYHRYGEDLALLRDLGAQAYRFSVAWPRVQPTGRGAVEMRGLDFYDRLVDELLELAIEPWICLYHWDLPQALQDSGGWPNRDLVGRYVDYAVAVLTRLGDRAATVALFNEPSIVAILGHLYGRHAPGLRDLDACLAAAHHLNLATGTAVEILRSERPGLPLGTILALNRVEPATDSAADGGAAERLEAFWNSAYLDPLLHARYPEELAPHMKPFVLEGDLERCQQSLDFLGVNYYTRMRARSRKGSPALDAAIAPPPGDSDTTAMDWEIYPDGLLAQLLHLHRHYDLPPLYVTENGAAFDDERTVAGKIHDRRRIDYLARHLDACAEAIERGVDLRGYFVWSLLDNFEWAEGCNKRFGLVHVDYETLERTPKDSFRWFAEVARTRRVG